MVVTSIRRVGLFGGSFDPPHVGHLAIAEFVANERQLDEILFVVSHIQWQKAADRKMLDSRHRFEMVKLAISNVDYFSASSLEIDRGGDSVTLETLESLHAQDPTAEYELIIGEDIASTLSTWRRSEELEIYADIVVVGRPGFRSDAAEQNFNFVFAKGPQVNISSQEIRSAIKSGLPISHLVPEEVEKYIRSEGLYSEGLYR